MKTLQQYIRKTIFRALVVFVVNALVNIEEVYSQESPHGILSLPCADCHSTDSFRELRRDLQFNHSERTRFQLTGQHKNIRCQSCHHSLKFSEEKGSLQCVSCHTDQHRGEVGKQCERCHTTQSWVVTDIVEKHQASRFPLLGIHRSVSCVQCHTNQQKNEFVGLPVDCAGCHREDYQRSKYPSHNAVGISFQCEDCHQITSSKWNVTTFLHPNISIINEGIHSTLSCESCHNKKTLGTPKDCFGCHQNSFVNAVNPNHVTGQFSHDCKACHTATQWKPATFNHIGTQFPLTGSHQSVLCEQCHSNGNYTSLSSECFSCHESDFSQTQNPNHIVSQFSHNCETCHSTNGWQPATFNHATTQFPLSGAHQTTACQECHTNGNYTNLPMDCWSCHETDFSQTTNPNHTTAQFSHLCESCHNTVGWQPSTFNHTNTQFPLTGAHVATPCQQCHINGNYTNIPTDCWSCHEQDYTSANEPPHTLPNFSHTCTECHTTETWDDASFNHSVTQFPLTGAHISASCQQCHVNGNYTNVPTDCYPCHQTDFTSAPQHSSKGYPHNCTTSACHNTSNWNSAFNHTPEFPIAQGTKHRPGRWNVCSDCHPNANNFSVFTCTTSCHPQNEMNNEHNDVSGYIYQSAACYDCHPTGEEGVFQRN
ncbi:MAG: hypothetical protein FJ218_01125 [Ignavibacteria bacterium]|nr:hypothetical protein [Ignavibacteria bacterium]